MWMTSDGVSWETWMVRTDAFEFYQKHDTHLILIQLVNLTNSSGPRDYTSRPHRQSKL